MSKPRTTPDIVIGGAVTPEEAAAVVAALVSLGGGDQGGETGRRRSLWSSRARAARPRLSPGPGAWRGSTLPR